jgi:hypothetical protein
MVVINTVALIPLMIIFCLQPIELIVKHLNPFPNIKCNYASKKEIESIIKSLKPTNSHGYDEISFKILNVSSHLISSLISCICNKSLSTVIFPSHLKYSVIKPLFKKGDTNSMSVYRPVSLLTNFLLKNF